MLGCWKQHCPGCRGLIQHIKVVLRLLIISEATDCWHRLPAQQEQIWGRICLSSLSTSAQAAASLRFTLAGINKSSALVVPRCGCFQCFLWCFSRCFPTDHRITELGKELQDKAQPLMECTVPQGAAQAWTEAFTSLSVINVTKSWNHSFTG